MIINRKVSEISPAVNSCTFCLELRDGMQTIDLPELICKHCGPRIRPHTIRAHFPNYRILACPDCLKPEATEDRDDILNHWVASELAIHLKPSPETN
jgi:hypothetical protein